MAKSTLIKSRQAAFIAQGGQCFYCAHPMWQSDPEKFSQAYGVSPGALWRYQCTAEHLLPREEGGRDTRDNIVAACAYCNRQRHRPPVPRSVERHQAHVQRRMASGRWHPSVGAVPGSGRASDHTPGTGCMNRTGRIGSSSGP